MKIQSLIPRLGTKQNTEIVENEVISYRSTDGPIDLKLNEIVSVEFTPILIIWAEIFPKKLWDIKFICKGTGEHTLYNISGFGYDKLRSLLSNHPEIKVQHHKREYPAMIYGIFRDTSRKVSSHWTQIIFVALLVLSLLTIFVITNYY